ncbi:MAG: Flp pilus assembly complex ATPase component TadA [Succinivibrio sp.]|nr:Flp pilus assembly complex ATPase component TadA [Succinivibrio sp.]
MERASLRLESALGEEIISALADESISEIMVNADGQVFCETRQQGLSFLGRLGAHQAEGVVRTMAKLLNQDLKPLCPVVSGKLPHSEARFEGLLPPLVPNPCFCIRSHHALTLSFAELAEQHFITDEQADLLRDILKAQVPLIICGPTGCGKTTLLNACLKELSILKPQMRVISIEDTAELQIPLRNHVALHPSAEADFGLLLRSSLRLRPDLIVVGEVRGMEALDLIDALTTGHSGLATLHAGSVPQALKRLCLLISRHPQAPEHLEALVSEGVKYLAILGRSPARRLLQIARVEGFVNAQFKFSNLSNME